MEPVPFPDFFKELGEELDRLGVRTECDMTKTLLSLAVLHHRHAVEKRSTIVDVNNVKTTSTDIDLIYMILLQRSELNIEQLKKFVMRNRFYLKEGYFSSLLAFTKKHLDVVMEPLYLSYLVYLDGRTYKTTGLSVLVQAMIFDTIFSYYEPTLQHYAETFDMLFDVINTVNMKYREAISEGTLYYVTLSVLKEVAKRRGKEYDHFLGSIAFDVLSKTVATEYMDENDYITRRFAMLV